MHKSFSQEKKPTTLPEG